MSSTTKGTRRIQRSEASLTPYDPILKWLLNKQFISVTSIKGRGRRGNLRFPYLMPLAHS